MCGPDHVPCECADCGAEITGADRTNADLTCWLCPGCWAASCAEIDAELAARHDAGCAAVANDNAGWSDDGDGDPNRDARLTAADLGIERCMGAR